jgi:EAL domain-containing protein (putative c-di-GMP-specific phosphodiesterase class I)
VVAEGVETAGELDGLRSMGCDFAQGYYWQRPCPAEKMEELLAAGFDP